MRIGMVAPPWIPVPAAELRRHRAGRGGARRAGWRGAGTTWSWSPRRGSTCRGVRRRRPSPRVPDVIGPAADEWRTWRAALALLADVDVVIDHSGPLGALLTRSRRRPRCTSCTARSTACRAGIYAGIARHVGRPAPGGDQPGPAGDGARPALRRGLPQRPRPRRGTVPRAPDGYLAFLGRMSPEKGPPTRSRIARGAGLPLLIAAKCREPAEQEYFAAHVAPRLGAGRRLARRARRRRASTRCWPARRALVFPIAVAGAVRHGDDRGDGRAARRCSPPRAARCRRSWPTGSPASSAPTPDDLVARRRPHRSRSTAPRAASTCDATSRSRG